MSLIIGRHKNSPHIRVTIERQAEHIENLALKPVRSLPDTPHRRQVRIVFIDEDLDPEPVIEIDRIELVNDRETRRRELTEIETTNN